MPAHTCAAKSAYHTRGIPGFGYYATISMCHVRDRCRHRAHAFANNYACNGRLTLTLPLIPDDAMSGRKEQPRAIIALDLSKSMRRGVNKFQRDLRSQRRGKKKKRRHSFSIEEHQELRLNK